MNTSMQDQMEGKFLRIKEKVKEVAGEPSDGPKLKAEGIVENKTEEVQEKTGQAQKGGRSEND